LVIVDSKLLSETIVLLLFSRVLEILYDLVGADSSDFFAVVPFITSNAYEVACHISTMETTRLHLKTIMAFKSFVLVFIIFILVNISHRKFDFGAESLFILLILASWLGLWVQGDPCLVWQRRAGIFSVLSSFHWSSFFSSCICIGTLPFWTACFSDCWSVTKCEIMTSSWTKLGKYRTIKGATAINTTLYTQHPLFFQIHHHANMTGSLKDRTIWNKHLHPSNPMEADCMQLQATILQILHNMQQDPHLHDLLTYMTWLDQIVTKLTWQIWQWVTNCHNHTCNNSPDQGHISTTLTFNSF